MKKILLAIEGSAPDSSTLSYAVSLCKRMRAGLEILQILSPRAYRRYAEKAMRGIRQAKNAFEDAMVAVAFAEAGQHEIVEQMQKEARAELDRLLPAPDRKGLQYQLTLKPGNPGDEIVRYVCDHRDVVLTIYDAAKAKNEKAIRQVRKRDQISAIAQNLPIPLVFKREGEPTGLRP